MRMAMPKETREVLHSWKHIDAVTSFTIGQKEVDHLNSPFVLKVIQGSLGNMA